MTDISFSRSLAAQPSTTGFRLHNAVQLSPSPQAKNTQRISIPGDWWRATASWANRDDPELHDLFTHLSALRGGICRTFFWDHTNPNGRGLMDVAELIVNGYDFNDTTDWTLADSGILSVNGKRLKVQNGGAASGEARSIQFTVVAGATYILRFDVFEGSTASWTVRAGTTANGNNLLDQSATTVGRHQFSFTAINTDVNITLEVDTIVTGDWLVFDELSLTRGALVQGASQTGRSLLVDNLEVSLNGARKRGDYFQVGQELKIFTMDLDSDAGGVGVAHFNPPLVAPGPADNTPVVFSRAGAPMVPSNARAGVGFDATPPIIAQFSMDFVEAANIGS